MMGYFLEERQDNIWFYYFSPDNFFHEPIVQGRLEIVQDRLGSQSFICNSSSHNPNIITSADCSTPINCRLARQCLRKVIKWDKKRGKYFYWIDFWGEVIHLNQIDKELFGFIGVEPILQCSMSLLNSWRQVFQNFRVKLCSNRISHWQGMRYYTCK